MTGQNVVGGSLPNVTKTVLTTTDSGYILQPTPSFKPFMGCKVALCLISNPANKFSCRVISINDKNNSVIVRDRQGKQYVVDWNSSVPSSISMNYTLDNSVSPNNERESSSTNISHSLASGHGVIENFNPMDVSNQSLRDLLFLSDDEDENENDLEKFLVDDEYSHIDILSGLELEAELATGNSERNTDTLHPVQKRARIDKTILQDSFISELGLSSYINSSLPSINSATENYTSSDMNISSEENAAILECEQYFDGLKESIKSRQVKVIFEEDPPDSHVMNPGYFASIIMLFNI